MVHFAKLVFLFRKIFVLGLIGLKILIINSGGTSDLEFFPYGRRMKCVIAQISKKTKINTLLIGIQDIFISDW